MSTIRNENNDLNAQVNSLPGKESDVTDFKQEWDALLHKKVGSLEEAVGVMAATVKDLRRKYADRKPCVNANYYAGEYLFWFGNCIFPQLQFCREECSRLRRTLKQGLRQKGGTAGQLNGGLWIYVNLRLGVLRFSGMFGVDTVFRLNRRRCRELIDVLAPANLDQVKREDEEE